jgi:hypothetical protein
MLFPHSCLAPFCSTAPLPSFVFLCISTIDKFRSPPLTQKTPPPLGSPLIPIKLQIPNLRHAMQLVSFTAQHELYASLITESSRTNQLLRNMSDSINRPPANEISVEGTQWSFSKWHKYMAAKMKKPLMLHFYTLPHLWSKSFKSFYH